MYAPAVSHSKSGRIYWARHTTIPTKPGLVPLVSLVPLVPLVPLVSLVALNSHTIIEDLGQMIHTLGPTAISIAGVEGFVSHGTLERTRKKSSIARMSLVRRTPLLAIAPNQIPFASAMSALSVLNRIDSREVKRSERCERLVRENQVLVTGQPLVRLVLLTPGVVKLDEPLGSLGKATPHHRRDGFLTVLHPLVTRA